MSQTKDESPFTSRLNASYQLGGQVYNDHFVYNPGFSTQFTQSYKLTESFEVGIGTGYFHLLDDSFIPYYFEVLGYKKNGRNSPLMRFQVGGTSAWYRSNNYPSDYSTSGRFFFSAGMGRKFKMARFALRNVRKINNLGIPWDASEPATLAIIKGPPAQVGQHLTRPHQKVTETRMATADKTPYHTSEDQHDERVAGPFVQFVALLLGAPPGKWNTHHNHPVTQSCGDVPQGMGCG